MTYHHKFRVKIVRDKGFENPNPPSELMCWVCFGFEVLHIEKFRYVGWFSHRKIVRWNGQWRWD